MTESLTKRSDLGPVQARFRPGRGNLIAGGVLGSLFTIGGGAFAMQAIRQVPSHDGKLPFQAEGRADWIGVGVLAFIGMVGIVIGVVLFILVYTQLLSFSVTVCADGFYCSRQGKRTDFPWDSVASVEETITHVRMHVLGEAKYLLPKRESRLYTVRRKDGKTADFYEDNVKRLPEFVSLLHESLDHRPVRWIVKVEKE